MKKILIPTLLTVTSTPLISLVGCGKPEIEDLEKYQVTDQEMQDALSMKGIEYLQIKQSTHWTGGAASGDVDGEECLSPTCYSTLYGIKSETPYWTEKYVLKETTPEESYIKYARTFTDPDNPGELIGPTPVSSDDFWTTELKGEIIFNEYYYTIVIRQGFHYTFNPDKKCYSTFGHSGESDITIELYFENKRLVKNIASDTTSIQSATVIENYEYKEYTPEPPIQ